MNFYAKPYYVPSLDGLRFLAFLFVFFHHFDLAAIPIVASVSKIGWFGVDIFFCLSAFLLTRLLCLEFASFGRINVWHFFFRRLLRIWPLYFGYVVACILLHIYMNGVFPGFFTRALGLLTFTDNIAGAYLGYNPVFGTPHLWTISYEEQFYLALPFLMIFLFTQTKRVQNFFLIGMLVIGSLIRLGFIVGDVPHPAIWVLPLTHFEAIITGMWLGLNEGKIKYRYSLLITLVSLMMIAILPDTAVSSYHLMFLYPLIGLGTGSLLVSVLNEETILNKFLTHPIILYLGKISFGLYIFHIPSIWAATYFLDIFHLHALATIMALSFSLTVGIASASYYIWERPFLKLKKNFGTVLPEPDKRS